MNQSIHSAAELWRFFVERAGLEPDGWDAPLVAELRTELELLPAPAELHKELAARNTSVEELLLALLQALEPFGGMLSDLLELFAEAGIESSGDTAAIAFDFDYDGGELRFELDAFRRARTILREAQVEAAVRAWNHDTLWGLWNALAITDSLARRMAPATARDTEVARWLDEYERSASWPSRPLEPPRSGHAALDGRLAAVWGVWRWVLEQAQALASGQGELTERWRAQRTTDVARQDALLDLIGLVESDRWLAGVAKRAFDLADHLRPEDADSQLVAQAVAQIDEVLSAPHQGRQPYRKIVEQLEDVLDLPFWKHRHELFAAWVLTRILDALAPTEVELHHDDGVLRFAFTATHLATARLDGQAISVWSEVRSQLDSPLGSSRKAGIQPDYSLIPGEEGFFYPMKSVLEVECKQYKRAAIRPFAEVLADYARGRPNAEVVLVDHGPVNASRTLARPELETVAARTHVIGGFAPGQEPALRQFMLLARGALWPEVTRTPDPPLPPPGPIVVVRVVWTPTPEDVELHLFFTDADEDRHHAHRGATGDLHMPPFVRHELPAGPLPEQVRFVRQQGLVYDVAVSANGSSRRGGAANLELSWERQSGTLGSGWIPPGRWWHAFRVQTDGTVTIVDRTLTAPPAA